jgi:hypothetical protein
LAGSGGLCAAGGEAAAGLLGAAAGFAGAAAWAPPLAPIGPMAFSCAFHALAHSGHRKPPAFLCPALVCGTACFLQSACSQLPHFVTACSPQGFFFSNPVSTVHASMASP